MLKASASATPSSDFNKKPPLSTLKSTIVRLEVENSEVAFDVHKDLLRYHSSFFRGALNSNFVESKTNVFKLEEKDPNIVEAFVRWAYFGHLDEPEEKDETAKKKKTAYLSQMMLAKIWIFGDKRGIPAMQNLCIQELHKLMADTWTSDPVMVPFVYENTVARSILRLFFVEYVALTEFVDKYSMVAMKRDNQDWNSEREFLLDLAMRIHRQGGPQSIVQSRIDVKKAWRELDISKFYVSAEEPRGKTPPAGPMLYW